MQCFIRTPRPALLPPFLGRRIGWCTCLDYQGDNQRTGDICVRRAQRPSVVDARVLQDSVSTLESDHRLVLACIRLRFPGVKPSRQLAPQPDLKVLRIVLKDADKMSAEEQAAMTHRDDFLAVFDARGSRQHLHAIPPPGDFSVILRGIAAKYRLAARTLPSLPPRRQLAVHRHAPTVVAARQMLRRNRDPTAKPGLQAALRVAYEQAEKADAQQMVKDLRSCQQKHDGKWAWFWYKRLGHPDGLGRPHRHDVPGAPAKRLRTWAAATAEVGAGQLRRPRPCRRRRPPGCPGPGGPAGSDEILAAVVKLAAEFEDTGVMLLFRDICNRILLASQPPPAPPS
eukprot:jgi/Mesvir1/7438/Mv25805-RA.1